MAARFIDLADLCEILAISMSQARALVKSGELPAIQIGGRGQWRVETSVLERYIQEKYQENAHRVITGTPPEPEPQPEPEDDRDSTGDIEANQAPPSET